MTDTNEALFKIAGNISDAVWSLNKLAEEIGYTQRPSAIFRPSIGLDGNKWCALYGPNLQEGVAGFGDSPADAMADFDKNWNVKIGVAP